MIRLSEIKYFRGNLYQNYPKFPESKGIVGYQFSFGARSLAETSQNIFYHFPIRKISFSYYNLGNADLLGSAFFLIPKMEFRFPGNITLEGGIGMAYVTRSFRQVPENRVLGSQLNWGFETDVSKKISWNKNIIGISYGFMHDPMDILSCQILA